MNKQDLANLWLYEWARGCKSKSILNKEIDNLKKENLQYKLFYANIKLQNHHLDIVPI